MEISEDQKYTIVTRAGKLKTKLERNAFELTSFKGLKIVDVPNNEASLREIVRNLSVGNGQGFKRCSCKGGFSYNRCKCRKDNLTCNSFCLSGRSCLNN